MTTHTPRPLGVTTLVGDWIRKHRADAKAYDNATFAIDTDGIVDLHELAAAIYQQGFTDGMAVGLDIANTIERDRRDREDSNGN